MCRYSIMSTMEWIDIGNHKNSGAVSERSKENKRKENRQADAESLFSRIGREEELCSLKCFILCKYQ